MSTSSSNGYQGKLYIRGRAGIVGTATDFVYRLLDANGNVIQDWSNPGEYQSNATFRDLTNSTASGSNTYLNLAQAEVPGVEHVYEFFGLADITAFPGQTVTVECAFILDGVEGEDAYYTFMILNNVYNKESAS